MQGFQIKVTSLSQSLSEELRIAENLRILTPFQRSTKEAIEMAIPPTAANVRHLRTELCRTRCWSEMLEAEIDIERGRLSDPRLQRAPRLTLSNPNGLSPPVGSAASGGWGHDLVSKISGAVARGDGSEIDNGLAEDIGVEILAAIDVG